MQRKPVNPYPVILSLLSRGEWYAPHEVQIQLRLAGCRVAPEATTARIRDLRKPKYGRWNVPKRRREGTEYYEYRCLGKLVQPAEQTKAA